MWTLCSKQDVVSITHAPESALEDFWSSAVEGMIRRYLGMPYLGMQVEVDNEYHNGDGTNILMVRKPPIISVQHLSLDGAVLLPNEYLVGEYGVQLFYRTFTKGVLNVSISYTSGSVEVDPIVNMTAVAMIAAIWNYRNRGGADSSIKWGAAPVGEGEHTPNVNVGLTSHLDSIMKRMLRRGKVRVS